MLMLFKHRSDIRELKTNIKQYEYSFNIYFKGS